MNALTDALYIVVFWTEVAYRLSQEGHCPRHYYDRLLRQQQKLYRNSPNPNDHIDAMRVAYAHASAIWRAFGEETISRILVELLG